MRFLVSGEDVEAAIAMPRLKSPRFALPLMFNWAPGWGAPALEDRPGRDSPLLPPREHAGQVGADVGFRPETLVGKRGCSPPQYWC